MTCNKSWPMAQPHGQDERIKKVKSSVNRMLSGASIAGVSGAAWGACIATVRNESVKYYAISMGANFCLLSSTFIVMEEILADKFGKRDATISAISGATTGGLYAGIIAGRLRGLQGAIAGAAVGAVFFIGKERFNKWRLSKAVERYEQKYGQAPIIFYPNTQTRVEKRLPQKFDLPSFLPQSAKVTDDEIERRIQSRVKELWDEENDGAVSHHK